MAMPATQIRRGMVLVFEGEPCRVVEFRHHTPGNLRAMVQAKLKNLRIRGVQMHIGSQLTSATPFAEAVVSRLATGLPEPQRAARARLSSEGWSAKAADFRRWVFGPAAEGSVG